MTPLSRRAFLVQVIFLLIAVSGWAAFAGTYLQLLNADYELREARRDLHAAYDQNDRMREGQEEMLNSQQGLIRVLQDDNRQLRERLNTYEARLKQLGIIQ
jgi:hypothetical protein